MCVCGHCGQRIKTVSIFKLKILQNYLPINSEFFFHKSNLCHLKRHKNNRKCQEERHRYKHYKFIQMEFFALIISNLKKKNLYVAICQGAANLFGFKKRKNIDVGWGKLLPAEFLKFREECRLPKTPVHYISKPGKYERDELTGEVKPVQNVPLPLLFPRESHQGIWGGEAVIKGFTKKKLLVRRCPHFWTPQLKKTVVRSEILNKFMSMVVTERTMELIHQHYGFDNYILETKGNDLQSFLALSIKREMLKAIHAGCPALKDEPEKQQEILAKYKKFGDEVSGSIHVQVFVKCV